MLVRQPIVPKRKRLDPVPLVDIDVDSAIRRAAYVCLWHVWPMQREEQDMRSPDKESLRIHAMRFWAGARYGYEGLSMPHISIPSLREANEPLPRVYDWQVA